jgi:sortase A
LVTIVLGVIVLLDVAVTLVWQEPVTAVIAMIKHDQIDKRYLSYSTAPLTRADNVTLRKLSPAGRTAFLARLEERELRTGDAAGHISIPKIGLSFLFVQGTDEASLQKGPGHYPSTALPGLNETVAIAGHRTTYLAPFRHLDALRRGDRIVLRMPYGRFTYRVQYTRIVRPDAWWITRNVGYERLVLSACNPVYSAAQRIVVFAKLSHADPTPAQPRSAATIS